VKAAGQAEAGAFRALALLNLKKKKRSAVQLRAEATQFSATDLSVPSVRASGG